MAFTLHPKLADGGFPLARLAGCQLMLKDNALFPWLILVPETEVEDLDELEPGRYREVCETVRLVSLFVKDQFRPEKLNVACIGNVVRQMHIHIVGRSPGDPAWPGTVWAHEGRADYAPGRVEEIRRAVREWFEEV